MHVVTWSNDELSTDALPVHGFEHYKAKDYLLAHAPFTGKVYLNHMVCNLAHNKCGNCGPLYVGNSYTGGQWAAGDEPFYYIVSPKDVIIAKPRLGTCN